MGDGVGDGRPDSNLGGLRVSSGSPGSCEKRLGRLCWPPSSQSCSQACSQAASFQSLELGTQNTVLFFFFINLKEILLWTDPCLPFFFPSFLVEKLTSPGLGKATGYRSGSGNPSKQLCVRWLGSAGHNEPFSQKGRSLCLGVGGVVVPGPWGRPGELWQTLELWELTE